MRFTDPRHCTVARQFATLVLLGATTAAIARPPASPAAAPAGAVASSPAATRHAELRLARRFGLGRGVPQSYANAGAWITGKGRSDEALEAWDYSIGYAYTIVAELLAGVRYPVRTGAQPLETSFVVEVDARRPTQVVVRMTDGGTNPLDHLDVALEQAFTARLAQTLPWLAPADPHLVVPARVTVPVSIRYRSPTDVAVLEGELLLR